MRAIALILFLLVVGCGRTETVNPGPPPNPVPVPQPTPDPGPVPVAKKVILATWGAHWCHFCHTTIPEIQRELDKLPKAVREVIDFRLYVPTGRDASQAPTDAESLRFRDSLGVSAVAYSDPKWKMFRYAFPGSTNSLPGGAVMAMDLKVIKAFYPGQLNAREIVWAAEQAAR